MRLSVKQVAWLQSLLHAMDRDMPYTNTYTLPVNGLPRSLVVYPNGAGFIKVEDFAMEFVDSKWRVKPQYAALQGAYR